MLKLSRLPDGEPEVFTTIQGEGVSAGVPSTFAGSPCARCVSGATLLYLDWERYDPRVEIVRLEVPEVARRVLAGGTRNVVITEGSPFAAGGGRPPGGGAERGREAPGGGDQRDGAPAAGPGGADRPVERLPQAASRATRRAPEVPEALRWFAAEQRLLKFVITAPEDVEEARGWWSVRRASACC